MDDMGSLLQEEFGLLSRRLRGMAMVSRGIVPNLIISQKVVDKITKIAHAFIEDETGESMLGFVVDSNEPESMPSIYILDTISPDEEETLRRTHTFQQGDDLQDEIIWWLQENWRLCRERKLDTNNKYFETHFDVPLRYLGDWHKQPGFMIQPSGGDLNTALSWMDDSENNMEYLLVPIVTLGHDSVTDEEGAQVNYFTVPINDGTSLRVDWWYIHRDVRVFQPISPQILPEDKFPALAAYPWHLTKPDFAEEEVDSLREDGLFVELLVWQVDDKIPMELCAFVARPGASKVIILATEHDYPQSAPRAYIAPFTRWTSEQEFYDIFEMHWSQAEKLEDLKDFQWDSDKYLIDFVHAIEEELGIVPPRRPAAIQIEVDEQEEESPAQEEISEEVASSLEADKGEDS